jgi:glycosyltransferase involved in cell wall biosynthesis
MSRPFVSCICPTYNRRRFLPFLLQIFNNQTYPKDRRELIIVDDSPESNADIIKQYNVDKNIRYYHVKEKMKLGKKRNYINSLVKGEYVVCFDDDDYYPPERISHAITMLQSTKRQVAGSTRISIYYTALDKIYEFGPYGPNHATNGTFAYHRDFLQNHKYEDDANMAEEKYFLKEYSEPMVQLDPYKTILCISHAANTFDKHNVIHSGRETGMKLKQVVKGKNDKYLIDFYKSLHEEAKKRMAEAQAQGNLTK